MSALGRLRFRLRSIVVERLFTYGTPEFAQALAELGIREGDVVMVHASLRRHGGYTGRPVDMIAALKAAVGRRGLVVMPSMTYTDSSKAFLARGGEMNAARSASRVGLLSEVFRRGKDVHRSLSPTHPLLAWGDGAEAFVAGHERTDRPFGPDSPFQRLLDRDGKILCIDAIPQTITFTHFLEDRIHDRLPFPLYEADRFEGRVIDARGDVHIVPTRVLSDESRRRRQEHVLWKQAGRSGIARKKRLGNSRLMLVGCSELASLVETMHSQGRSIFAERV
jgi:aminoglycoside 3-N-acetyltransferase